MQNAVFAKTYKILTHANLKFVIFGLLRRADWQNNY
jgi:hypothetical protein